MASTYSSYKIELIATGEQDGTWGITTNNNFQYAIEQAIGGYATQALTTTSTSLNLTDSNALQNARALFLKFTGTPGAGATVVLPSIQKLYFINNAISTYDLIVKTSVVPSGTYGRSGNTVTVTVASTSTYSTGQTVNLTFSAGTGGTATSGNYQITVINSTQFTVTDSASGTITGSPNVDIADIVIPNGKTACVYVNGTQVIGTANWLPSLTTSSLTLTDGATFGGSLSVAGSFSVGSTTTGATYGVYTKTSTKITVNGTGFSFAATDNVYVVLSGGDAPSGVYTVDSSPAPTSTAFTATPAFANFPTGTTGGNVTSVTKYNNTSTFSTPIISFGSPGTAGQALVSQGSGIPPVWTTLSSASGNWSVSGNLSVTGTSTFTGAATFNGNTTFGSTSVASGTYGRSGTTVTVTSTAHGFSNGQQVYLVFSAGTGGTATTGYYSLTVVDANTFTVTDGSSGTITGSPDVSITTAGTYGRSGTTVTVTTAVAHGFSNNQVLNITFAAGTGGTATSGIYTITTAGPSSTTFTVTDTASGTINSGANVSFFKYNNTSTLQAPLSSFGSVGTAGYLFASQGASAPPKWVNGVSSLTNSTEKVSVDSSGNLTAVVPSGSTLLPAFLPRAWVNFDGTTAANVSGTYSQTGTTTVTVTITAHGLIPGNVIYADITSGTGVDGTYTVLTATTDTFTYTAGTSLTTSGNITLLRRNIRGSGNVGSVTYNNSTGQFYINFSTAMPDANYCVTATASRDTTAFNSENIVSIAAAPTTGALAIGCETGGGTATNPLYGCVTVIR